MLKQMPSRNQRSKGFKVKDVVQICVLLVICIWLIYQLANKTYGKKLNLDSSRGITGNQVENGQALVKLGRKGGVNLNPLFEGELTEAYHKHDDDDDDDDEEGVQENGKLKASGDDEMDGGGLLPKTEEEEPELLDDLIDEDDGDKEGAVKGAT